MKTEGLTAMRGLDRSIPVTLADLEALARTKLAPDAWAFYCTGAADEHTLANNVRAFERIELKPRVLVDVSKLDTRVSLFGTTHEAPIILAPTALNRLADPDGELTTAAGAALGGVAYCTSCLSSCSITEIGKAARTPLWMQLFVQTDRGFTRALVERAEAAGCQAICLTTDMPVIGPRKSGLPPKSMMGNFGVEQIDASIFDATVTWDIIDWIRSFSKMQIVLKGMLAPEDAAIAVERGASAIVVSNHGARQLDTVPATITALPLVAAAVNKRIPVLLDGGIRRGTDIYKALALGADAVLIGRPYLWGLAVGGANGVKQVVQILRNELEIAMSLCGTPRLADIGPQAIW